MLSLLATLAMGPVQELPPIPREFRGVWVATVNNIDWPSTRTLSSLDQQQELLTILERCRAMNLNAVVLQIRPSADALYRSSLEPWSEFLTGRQGQPPNPDYDPLEFAVREAHRRGLELHVWFNPYRARHFGQKGPLDPIHIAKTNPEAVYPYSNFLWMDPGSPVVRKRTMDVMLDVARRYDVDGIHIDDYFYPYPVAGQKFPDDRTYQAYRDRGGRLSRDDWRRKNVDDFVRDFYAALKKERPEVAFGISPFGIYRPGVPAGIEAGLDQYAQLYADARKWLREGWCDYYAPQLYWPIAQTKQSYPVLLDWWLGENPKRRHIFPGNYTSRTNPTAGNWPASEVVRQIEMTREKGAGGNIHFSMKAFLEDWNGVRAAVAQGPYLFPAAVPASPWMSSKKPSTPQPTLANGMVRWNAVPGARFYAVATAGADGMWRPWTFVSGTSASVARAERAAVVALSQTSVASDPGFTAAR